jgi:hypothetical protein
MRDLENAGRAVVAEPVVAPTAVNVIEARGRRRRRRRSGLRAAVAVVAAIGVIASVVAVLGNRGTSARQDIVVAPTDKAITDPQMRAHLGLDVPASWAPVDYGDVRLFAPPDWKVTAGGCGGTAPGWIEVGGPYKEECGVRAPTFIGVYAFADQHEAAAARTVHGYVLYRANAANPNDYVVPALDVTIRAEGPKRDEILDTLAPSSRFIALTAHEASPGDWRTVSYSGITMRVPNGWGQSYLGPCESPPAEHVGLENSSGIANGCPPISTEPSASGPTHDNVVIGRSQRVSPATQYSVQISTSNGASLLLAPDADDRALAVVVRLDATHGVPLGIGLGRDGRVAAAILNSIRVDAAVNTTTPDESAQTRAAIIGIWQPLSVAGYDGRRCRGGNS